MSNPLRIARIVCVWPSFVRVSARRKAHAFIRIMLSVFLIAGTCFVPVRKAEAFAPALPAVGGAAALAAELGISVETLSLAFGAMIAAGTGLYVASELSTDTTSGLWGGDVLDNGYEWNWNSKWQDGSQNLPGFDAWGDLTPEQQAQYGNPRAYTQSQWDAWLLQAGLLEETQTGGPAPTGPPDDPDKQSAWYKLRNSLTALASDGTVAIGESADMLMMMMALGASGLFQRNDKTTGTGLGLTYETSLLVGDIVRVPFVTFSGTAIGSTSDLTIALREWLDMKYTETTQDYYLQRQYVNNEYVYPTPDIAFAYNSDETGLRSTQRISSLRYGHLDLTNGTFTYNGAGNQHTIYINYGAGYDDNFKLNYNYAGNYSFPDGAVVTGGTVTGGAGQFSNTDYGQMAETPEALTNAIPNNTNYNNYFTNINNNVPEGQQITVTIPENYGQPDYEPSYDDFVKPKPNTDVTPIPDDEQITPEDVINPTPPPNPPDPGEEPPDFNEKVNELLRQPLEQAFPFCLMADLRRLTQMVVTSIETDNVDDELVVPLDDFNVQGLDDLTFDLEYVKQFGNTVRPYVDLLFIFGLFVLPFKMFLNRGGE